MKREEKARKIRAAIIELSRKPNALSPNEIRVILALERIVTRLASDPSLDKHLAREPAIAKRPRPPSPRPLNGKYPPEKQKSPRQPP